MRYWVGKKEQKRLAEEEAQVMQKLENLTRSPEGRETVKKFVKEQVAEFENVDPKSDTQIISKIIEGGAA